MCVDPVYNALKTDSPPDIRQITVHTLYYFYQDIYTKLRHFFATFHYSIRLSPTHTYCPDFPVSKARMSTNRRRSDLFFRSSQWVTKTTRYASF